MGNWRENGSTQVNGCLLNKIPPAVEEGQITIRSTNLLLDAITSLINKIIIIY